MRAAPTAPGCRTRGGRRQETALAVGHPPLCQGEPPAEVGQLGRGDERAGGRRGRTDRVQGEIGRARDAPRSEAGVDDPAERGVREEGQRAERDRAERVPEPVGRGPREHAPSLRRLGGVHAREVVDGRRGELAGEPSALTPPGRARPRLPARVRHGVNPGRTAELRRISDAGRTAAPRRSPEPDGGLTAWSRCARPPGCCSSRRW